MSDAPDGIKPIDYVVPWHEQTMMVSKLYECRRCNTATEAYRAINNIVKYCHLCKACWEEDINKTGYMMVEKRKDIKWLIDNHKDAYNALPECYQADSCLEFWIENNILYARPIFSQIYIVGNWTAYYNKLNNHSVNWWSDTKTWYIKKGIQKFSTRDQSRKIGM